MKSTQTASLRRTEKAKANVIPLVRQYQKSQNPSILEEIVQNNIGLVKSIAIKFANHGEPVDDLIQSGYVGLINAVNNFDLSRGTLFSTYATYMISGEIRHYLRSARIMRTPRWVSVLSRSIDKSVDRLSKKLGRLPKVKEIAQDLNITEEGVLEVLKNRRGHTISSLDDDDRYKQGDLKIDASKIQHISYRSFSLPVEDRIALYQAIDRLTGIEKQVVYFVFYKDLNQTEIGKKIRKSQRQVSRILLKALGNLRDDLK